MRLTRALSLFAVLLVGSAKADEVKLPFLAVYEPTMASSAKAEATRLKVDPLELSRQTEEGLRGTRRFVIFERSKEVLQGSVMREQDLAQSGMAAGNAAALGKLSNVQFIVQPEITALKIGSTFAPVDEFPGHSRRNDSGTITVTFKLLDTTTAELKFQTTQTAGFSSGGGVVAERGGGVGAETYPNLAREVALKGVNASVNYISPIQVIRVQAGDLFLNRGEGGGLKLGELWTLNSAGEDLIDPVTHESLGASETPLGSVKIVRIGPRFSVAQPVGKLSGAVKEGDVLRPVSSSQK